MRNLRLVVAVALVVIGTQAVGAAAFPVDPLQDGSDAVQSADDPLVLDEGDVSGLALRDDGTLVVGGADGPAEGVNVGGRFTYGNPAAPTTQPAFTITNTDTEHHDVSIEYAGVTVDNSEANVRFHVYDASGTKVATVTEETGPTVVPDVAGGATLYVVVVVDTTGVTDEADLSGSLTVRI